MTGKEILRSGLSRCIVGSGWSRLQRSLAPKKGAMILYGHRVSDSDEGYLQGLQPAWFAEQIEYLARHYEIIPLSTLLRCFETGQETPHNSAVLTFDDGFRDNFEHAFPVLAKARIPAVIFLVTGSVDEGQLPWPQRLGYMFQKTAIRSTEGELAPGRVTVLVTDHDRYRACSEVKKRMRSLPRQERERELDRIADVLAVEAPRDRMLTWEQAREMQAAGIEFGAHTYSHSLLGMIAREEAIWEMERSRDDLRAHLGIDRPSFAFPGGSYTSELVSLARSLGFRSAFQSRRSLRVNNLRTTDQFALSRVGMPNAPAYVLEAEIDGPLHAIRSTYRA